MRMWDLHQYCSVMDMDIPLRSAKVKSTIHLRSFNIAINNWAVDVCRIRFLFNGAIPHTADVDWHVKRKYCYEFLTGKCWVWGWGGVWRFCHNFVWDHWRDRRTRVSMRPSCDLNCVSSVLRLSWCRLVFWINNRRLFRQKTWSWNILLRIL